MPSFKNGINAILPYGLAGKIPGSNYQCDPEADIHLRIDFLYEILNLISLKVV
jgi:hypothetical protein